jgi:hypothetical protein
MYLKKDENSFAVFCCHCKNIKLLAEKDHVIDIFTSEEMGNILLCIFRNLTVCYIIKRGLAIVQQTQQI